MFLLACLHPGFTAPKRPPGSSQMNDPAHVRESHFISFPAFRPRSLLQEVSVDPGPVQ